MVDIATLRRLALALPYAEDVSDAQKLAFSVAGKGFAWTWMERTAPKKPRQPRLDVLAVRCVPEEKDFLLALAPTRFFTEPHYNGFPAILVRLGEVDEPEMSGLLTSTWRCVAPKRLQGELSAPA